MLPFYIFYSCFGFQRVGDLIWAAGDSRCRGFLLGATAGRTTLSGEGLQHEDGSSHLLFSTVPNCVAYDPCFGYELTVILQDGMRRMLEGQEDVFYYVTVMNENYAHPAMPAGAQEGILRGMYRLSASALPIEAEGNGGGGSSVQRRVQLLGAGTILREAIAAGELLERDWGVAADVWSVTSFTELRREGLDVERHNRLGSDEPPLQSWVERCLAPTAGPIVAATDYMRAVPDMIRTWVPRRYVTLGTDGFGRSDTRVALRSFFEVDRFHITVAALKSLADDGMLDRSFVTQAIEKYGIDRSKPNPWDK
jgi:pyruvate dehydrogenase E1 component